MKVCNLTSMQKNHLVWRLDHKTGCGLLTAARIARGEIMADRTLVEIFVWAGKTPHSAKIHARKVMNYRLSE